ncbi:uroporphyrinogen-III synthase [Sulfolobus sp. S-194]|uniref:uroporphyrinogen-III synthase n=1 Tax=Sulfolobus sp. S-194 TaxID=2512240 RepID=UPI001436E3C6|nr:uroporphyrinogen-III synthase [Sulfolobus sp. S-194]QIW23054.1 uroporphyrinogen-III synthase [Sulfolobus sp. S-194]
MKVLFLRPEGSNIPYSKNFIEISILKPECINYSANLHEIDGLGFTSINAVRCFKEFDKIERKTIFAVGPSTLEELTKRNIKKVIIPEEYTVENLVKLMKQNTKNPLLVRSLIAIDNSLDIKQIADYKLKVDLQKLEEAKELIEKCKVDIIVLTSSYIASLVKDFIKDCEIIVSIGPSTSKAVKGKKNIYEAKEHDMKGILKLLKELGAYDG